MIRRPLLVTQAPEPETDDAVAAKLLIQAHEIVELANNTTTEYVSFYFSYGLLFFQVYSMTVRPSLIATGGFMFTFILLPHWRIVLNTTLKYHLELYQSFE